MKLLKKIIQILVILFGTLILYKALDLLIINAAPDVAELGWLPEFYEGVFYLFIGSVILVIAVFKYIKILVKKFNDLLD